jgi:phosphoribosylamine--glycine ligase
MSANQEKNILVIGGGGREHALCWKISQSPLAKDIYCAPGNGGTATNNKTSNVNLDPLDFKGIADFCLDKKIDLVVVGPDNPLAEGIVDYLEDKSIRTFGPNKRAAQLESSKSFAKQFMTKANIPTAKYHICHSVEEGMGIVTNNSWARVIKVDGLALGKGVFVCDNVEEARSALSTIFTQAVFGESGKKVVIEERLSGEEISLLTFCDGKTLTPMMPCQDHKRRFDNDKGPNTGGMGAYAPVSLYSQCQQEIKQEVLKPLQDALANELLATTYRGILYIGLMITKSGDNYKPYVLEFNARFGDPECQTLMPLLTSDLLPILWSCTGSTLSTQSIEWSAQSSCCVVAVTNKYPEESSRDKPITIKNLPSNVVLFHAGTRLGSQSSKDLQPVTNGGRILSVTGLGDNLEQATDAAYQALSNITFDDISYRNDIARRRTASCPSA